MKALGVEGDYVFKESSKYWDFSKKDVATELPEYLFWHNHLTIEAAIEGSIVRGFKRGSR